MTTYSELVKSFRAKNSKPKTGWRYESWSNPDVERIGMKPGGLVEPGVTHYAKTKHGQFTEAQISEINKLIKDTNLNQSEIAEAVNTKFPKATQLEGFNVTSYARKYFGISSKAPLNEKYKKRFTFKARKGKLIESILDSDVLKENITADFEAGMKKADILEKYRVGGEGADLLPEGVKLIGKGTLQEAYDEWGLERDWGELRKVDVKSDAAKAKAAEIRKYFNDPTLSREEAYKKLKMDRGSLDKFTRRWNETYPDDLLYEIRTGRYEGAQFDAPSYKKKTKQLQKFQTLLNRYADKPPRSGTIELARLIKLSGLSPVTFQQNLQYLRKIYKGAERPGFTISKNLKNKINKFPLSTGLTRDVLLAAGYSPNQLDKLERAQIAIRKLGDPGFKNQLEHAIPKSALSYLQTEGWIDKTEYNDLVGRVKPVTSYLNQWKKTYDNQLLANLKKYLESSMGKEDLNLYNKTQNRIIEEAQRISGGYKIGRIDVDLNGNINIKSPDKLFTKTVKGVGPTSRALIDYFKNLKYHNIIEQKYRKNSNNPAFGTLKGYLGEEKMPRYDTTVTKEIEKLSSHGDFIDYFNKNPNSPLLKGIERATRPGLPKYVLNMAKGKPGKIAALTILPFMLAAASPHPDKRREGDFHPPEKMGMPVPTAGQTAAGALLSKISGKFGGPDPLKYLRKVPRKILSSLATPTGAVAAWPGINYAMKKAGWIDEDTPALDIKSTGDRIGAEAELALAPELVKWTSKLTKPIKNQAARSAVTQLLNLGMKPATAMRVARTAQPLGLLSLGGEGLYHMYKKGHFDKERMMPSLMDQGAYEAAQQEQFDVNQPMLAAGGRVYYDNYLPDVDKIDDDK